MSLEVSSPPSWCSTYLFCWLFKMSSAPSPHPLNYLGFYSLCTIVKECSAMALHKQLSPNPAGRVWKECNNSLISIGNLCKDIPIWRRFILFWIFLVTARKINDLDLFLLYATQSSPIYSELMNEWAPKGSVFDSPVQLLWIHACSISFEVNLISYHIWLCYFSAALNFS